MSIRSIPYPPDFDDDYHHDHEWQRQERARRSLCISDVLAEVDSLIAAEEWCIRESSIRIWTHHSAKKSEEGL